MAPQNIVDVEFVAPISYAGDMRARLVVGAAITPSMSIKLNDQQTSVTIFDETKATTIHIPITNVKSYRLADATKPSKTTR